MAINTTLPIKTVTYNGAEIPIHHPSVPEPSYDTPTINVSAGGLITASANGKSATQQLATQGAASITPSESPQTAVASGRYTTGAVTVNAIPSNYIGSAVVIQKYYTGSSNPASSLGNNGDLYLKV